MVRASVNGVEAYPHQNYLLALGAPTIASRVEPGQFVMVSVSCLGTPAPLLKRALAVYSVRGSDITLLFKVVGEGTDRLSQLRIGDDVELIGPLGNGFGYDAFKNRHHFLVAGGIGIASLYLLAARLRETNQMATLVYGGRSRQDLVGLNDFRALGLDCRVTTDDGSEGRHGVVTEGLREALDDLPNKDVVIYTCGPTPMMEAVSRLAEKKGLPCLISVENRMACGFGVCLGCTVRTTEGFRLACTHGPVFPAEAFVWQREAPCLP